MALTLKRIELANIRSHTYTVFEPATTGITVIAGPTGAGKSTIVDSVSWILYGTKPKGVSKVSAIIREGTDLEQEKVYATMNLLVDNTELKIERRVVSKSGAVECEVWEKRSGEESFEHAAGPAVSHAEAYIKQRLRMDEKGFLAAVLVQQKQVDQLISAGSRERAEVIERLTGIASISKGLTEARQEYNQLKKAFAGTEVDEKTHEALQEELAAVDLAIQEGTKKRDLLQERHREAVEGAREAAAALQELEGKAARIEEVTMKTVKVTTMMQNVQENLERLLEEKEAKKAQLSSIAASVNLQDITRQLQDARQRLRQQDLLANRAEGSMRDLQGSLARNAAVFDEFAGVTEEEAKARLQEARRALEGLEEERAEARGVIASAQASMTKLKNALQIVKADEGVCPTCLQEIHDKEKAIASLEEEKQEIVAGAREAKKVLDASLERERSLREEEHGVLRLLEAFATQGALEQDLRGKTEEKAKAEAESKVLEGEVSGLQKVHADALREEEIKNEYDAILAHTVKLSDRQEQLREAEERLKAEKKELGNVSEGGLTRLRKRFADASQASSEAQEAYADLRQEVSLLEQRRTHLEENIRRAEEELERYQQLRATVEAHAKTLEVLEEFRQNRIKMSVPVVGTYASDLLSRFTEGTFVQLRLDTKFNATVTLSTGGTRAVGLLSGGELSAAALALRLAISMLLNSEASQNLLILDEVLVSQDTARAELILSTIKDVCKGQVIIISHGHKTTDIADEVFEMGTV